jgi:hypothetical protein
MNGVAPSERVLVIQRTKEEKRTDNLELTEVTQKKRYAGGARRGRGGGGGGGSGGSRLSILLDLRPDTSNPNSGACMATEKW